MEITGPVSHRLIEEAWLCRQRLQTNRGRVVVPEDELRRPVYVTPFDGAYGVAGYVVTINGSPPRLIALVECKVRGIPGDIVWVKTGAIQRVIMGLRPQRYQRLREAILAVVEAARQGCTSGG